MHFKTVSLSSPCRLGKSLWGKYIFPFFSFFLVRLRGIQAILPLFSGERARKNYFIHKLGPNIFKPSRLPPGSSCLPFPYRNKGLKMANCSSKQLLISFANQNIISGFTILLVLFPNDRGLIPVFRASHLDLSCQ
jgi:hypothetical protein